jgi:hypothetical protein
LVSQLEGLGYITIRIKVAGADFGLINMTKEGLVCRIATTCKLARLAHSWPICNLLLGFTFQI